MSRLVLSFARTQKHILNGVRKYSSQPKSSSSSFKPIATAVALLGTGSLLGYKVSKLTPDPEKGRLDRSTSPLKTLSTPQYADEAAYNKAVELITEVVGAENITTDKDVLASAADSFFNIHHPYSTTQTPLIVVYPSSTEDVSQLLKIANEYRVPIVANSGLTSLEAHNMHTRGPYSISVSFQRMNKILAFHPQDLDVVVQPGVGWQELDEWLLDREDGRNLLFGPDPGIGANIGGMVGTSASGTNAYKYGTMKENVINVTVVLADGTVVKTKQRPRKSAAGYDLTHLFIGSEGTLGLVTEITLKLNVRLSLELVTVATFDTIRDAAATAQKIITSGLQLNAVELLNTTMMSYVNKSSSADGKEFIEKPTLFLKLGGTDKHAIDQQLKIVNGLAKENNVVKLENSSNEDENQLLWAARRNGLWSTFEHGEHVLEDKKDVQLWVTDFAVPISHLAQVIAETDADLQANGFDNRYSVLGHVGDGNCHFLVVYNSKDVHKIAAIVDRMNYRAIGFGGTCTGEHSIGIGKRKYLEAELGVQAVDLMRHLKMALDPRRILNPDKVFEIDPEDTIQAHLDAGHVVEVGKPCLH
ncbi:uncharacterized protein KQ657_000651 [Scheffersomyces spartinae]|uniref:D-lactate dehydrogenase (cytochrome) n=1 Tax=Scheffersomyces spartinae TaxID=45513 RepID=A0A9P7V902_9ASCO|nr:uncharacterized protein KQ657_000651 [Scheffersomyces spartinae]KAG7193582.1 hypothetical protein KQ657_000651 [Scheffersomyces spartinae]